MMLLREVNYAQTSYLSSSQKQDDAPKEEGPRDQEKNSSRDLSH